MRETMQEQNTIIFINYLLNMILLQSINKAFVFIEVIHHDGPHSSILTQN
jgi:hypothetical protein